ncbi:MAG: hypothetical protein MRZ79_18650 [Bacteroidia bacterium]|nr:hypothetical protein [Bacteroidia bacterium]
MIRFTPTLFGFLLCLAFVACDTVLTDDEIEKQDLKTIEDYVATNQLEGEFTSTDLFVSYIDSGELSLRVDTLIQIDTLFDSTFVDTLRIDTTLLESKVLDSTFFFENPSSSDTIVINFTISDLNDVILFSTNGNPYVRPSGLYPRMTQLIDGFGQGLQYFAKGGEGILLLPSDLAYGRTGNGDDLAPNTPVRIDFELIDFF